MLKKKKSENYPANLSSNNWAVSFLEQFQSQVELAIA